MKYASQHGTINAQCLGDGRNVAAQFLLEQGYQVLRPTGSILVSRNSDGTLSSMDITDGTEFLPVLLSDFQFAPAILDESYGI